MKRYALLVAATTPLALSACTSGTNAAASDGAGEAAAITAADVEAAQKAWGEGIVAIGKSFTEEGDFRAAANEHIKKFYAYGDDTTILFKPTLAADDQFRESFDEAMSYFVGTEGTEDKGFAIKPWTAVRWENNGTIIDSDSAMAMGNYYFTDTEGNDTKVEYSFGYVRDENGDLKINLHHSSVPFGG